MLSLMLLTALLGQRPAAAPAQSADDAASEARHLKNVRQVTFGFAKAGEGYFRPDGKAIIFQAVPNTPPSIYHTPSDNETDYQIFTADLAPNATPRMVSTGKGACTCAYYHPDGKSILFASSHLNPTPSGQKGPAYSRSERYKWVFPVGTDIFKADLDGKNLVRLTDTPGYDAEGSYSPDGKQIVFTSFRDGNAEIYIMDADGKNPRRITNKPGYDGGPFFSPDGKKLIYRSDRKDNDLLQVFINNLEGTAERQLTSNEFVNWGPSFSPDSRHIIYATSKHGHQNYELYLMDVETGREERITFHDGFDGLPVFSPDGKRLMWTSSGRTDDKKSQLFIADFVMEPGSKTSAAR
ncbi:MAG: tolB 4 [Planctomycetota bacterium]|nr:tolB 4 [Planctomycetota bacterium]